VRSSSVISFPINCLRAFPENLKGTSPAVEAHRSKVMAECVFTVGYLDGGGGRVPSRHPPPRRIPPPFAAERNPRSPDRNVSLPMGGRRSYKAGMVEAANSAIDASEADAARRALNVALGERIVAVRKRVGVGQAECARGAGIDVSSMFRIERGGQNLTVETLARIAIALGVPLDELVIGIEPDPALVEPRSRA
jgi:DNA-binding XRE family transcriptional regulator